MPTDHSASPSLYFREAGIGVTHEKFVKGTLSTDPPRPFRRSPSGCRGPFGQSLIGKGGGWGRKGLVPFWPATHEWTSTGQDEYRAWTECPSMGDISSIFGFKIQSLQSVGRRSTVPFWVPYRDGQPAWL
jgi:hypothetical protein